MAELARAPGFQTHRSWWVAADAIDEVRWLRGRGEAKLKCGLTVPISRSNAAPLKAAGWF
jgi:DNA-binding LytR/AlgR family response regulator